MLLSFKRNLSQHRYLHITLPHLLSLYLAPLFLKEQFLFQFLLQGIHLLQEIRDQLIHDINLIEDYIVQFNSLV